MASGYFGNVHFKILADKIIFSNLGDMNIQQVSSKEMSSKSKLDYHCFGDVQFAGSLSGKILYVVNPKKLQIVIQ